MILPISKECNSCGIEKTIFDFYTAKTCADGYYGKCKKCVAVVSKRRWLKNRDKNYARNREYIIKNKEAINRKQREKTVAFKKTVLSHYSGGEPKCSCCGIKYLEFLTIDHVNNDGWVRRKNGEGRGSELYRKIIRDDFPKDFDVLCMNCNFAKGHGKKICPHKLEALVAT